MAPGHNSKRLDRLVTTDQMGREPRWYAEKAIEHGCARSVLDHHIGSMLYLRQCAATNFERALPAPESDLARQLLTDPCHLEFLIELKRTAFAPEAIGKLNFYVNVIDDQLRVAFSGISTPMAVAGCRLADLPPVVTDDDLVAVLAGAAARNCCATEGRNAARHIHPRSPTAPARQAGFFGQEVHPNAVVRQWQNCWRRCGGTEPTLWRSARRSIVVVASRLATESTRRPSGLPTGKWERSPRSVEVMGATTTRSMRAAIGSRVRMRTGRILSSSTVHTSR